MQNFLTSAKEDLPDRVAKEKVHYGLIFTHSLYDLLIHSLADFAIPIILKKM